MKVVCYFAAAEGAHKDCSTADYHTIWPVMQKSVEDCGYSLIHLTSLHEQALCERVFRVPLEASTVMFSREIAWLAFLASLEEGEQAVLVEPDCVLRKPIPPLADDKDMLLLSRPGKPIPSGFRLAKRSALPFYQAVVDTYGRYSDEEKVFHGDVRAMHEVLGLPIGNGRPPLSIEGVRIEVRDWLLYTSKLWKNAVAWNFKGWSKKIMLAMANGVMPEMR